MNDFQISVSNFSKYELFYEQHWFYRLDNSLQQIKLLQPLLGEVSAGDVAVAPGG